MSPTTSTDFEADDSETRCHGLPNGGTCTTAELPHGLQCRACQQRDTPPRRRPRTRPRR